MKNSAGYTLIELVVVLAIVGFIAAIAFWGLRLGNDSQDVLDAQRNFINQLRSVQTRANNGVGGLNTLEVTTVDNLPKDVTYAPTTSPTNFKICFNNPYVESSACTFSHASPIIIRFSKGSASKAVAVSYSGLFVTNINARD